MTVYADILLLVNFSMDFLTLYLTGCLLHKPMQKRRLIAAAFLGSAGGTVYSLTAEQNGIMGTLISVMLGLALSALMVRISFGRSSSKSSLLRDSLSVWGAGTLLGGIMTFLLSLGEPVYMSGGNNFLPSFAACFFVSIGMTRLFSTAKSKRCARVVVEALGQKCAFEALCDSGSFASEPISGKPVIIVRKTVLGEWSDKLASDACSLRLRMIPLHGIGGDCLLRGFLPDKVTVDGREVAAVIAIQESTGDFSGYDGIVPAVLCVK